MRRYMSLTGKASYTSGMLHTCALTQQLCVLLMSHESASKGMYACMQILLPLV